MTTTEPTQLRWRRDGKGGFVARGHAAGSTYQIRVMPDMGRGKSWRLFCDGVEVADAAGCKLKYVKHRACTHAAEHQEDE